MNTTVGLFYEKKGSRNLGYQTWKILYMNITHTAVVNLNSEVKALCKCYNYIIDIIILSFRCDTDLHGTVFNAYPCTFVPHDAVYLSNRNEILVLVYNLNVH